MIVKVCGLRDAENIRAVEATGPDWMGFIFHPTSKRFAGWEPPEYMPQCKRIGVFVDATAETICTLYKKWNLDMVQLHGAEPLPLCQELHEKGIPVIKALSIGIQGLPRLTGAYAGVCDYLLFDTVCATFGGSGKKFDWTCLQDYAFDTPFLLSGGISPEDIEEVLAISHPKLAGIDLNSRFETEPGLKDVEKLDKFIKAIRR
ncbi:MAG: phosphoribosylanthranilate isomerase [Bacteroidales bacterium]|nr:phosphoribosylanthranilate isomerase [Bacteroidales bacterium]